MRIRSVALALATIVACGGLGEPHGVSPSDVRLDRVYRLQDCITQGSSSPSTCAGWVSAHWGEQIDSSHLVLNAQGGVTWTTWITTTANPCYTGPSCPTTSKSVNVSTGTYALATNGINAQTSSGTLLFASTVAARVDPAWRGPDTLRVTNPFTNPNLLGQGMRFK